MRIARFDALVLALLLLLIALAAGCGKSDTEQIREVFAEYDQARKDGDYETACKALSNRLKDDVIATQQGSVQTNTCAAALKSTATPLPQGPIRSIEVNANEAYVQARGQDFNGRTGPGLLRMVKEDGDWKIQDFSPDP